MDRLLYRWPLLGCASLVLFPSNDCCRFNPSKVTALPEVVANVKAALAFDEDEVNRKKLPFVLVDARSEGRFNGTSASLRVSQIAPQRACSDSIVSLRACLVFSHSGRSQSQGLHSATARCRAQ